MDIKDKLYELLDMYSHIQVGNTFISREGYHRYDRPFFILCRTIEHGLQETKDNRYGKPVTFEDLHYSFRDARIPLVIDHDVLADILREALKEINRLESELEKAR